MMQVVVRIITMFSAYLMSMTLKIKFLKCKNNKQLSWLRFDAVDNIKYSWK